MNRTGDPDQAAAQALAVALGGLPLALEQAAAYIQATGTTLAIYLSLFQARRADLLGRGEAAGHPGRAAATLGLALSQLAQDTPARSTILRLLAFLAPEPVPLGVLLGQGDLGEDPAVTATVGPLAGDVLAEGLMRSRRCAATRWCPWRDGLVLVHRLVQPAARDHLTADRRPVAASRRHPDRSRDPRDPELPGSWPVCTVLLPHARVVLDLTSGGMWNIRAGSGL